VGLFKSWYIFQCGIWPDHYIQADSGGHGYPEYFRFLFDPEEQFFGIEPCGIDDHGANRLPEEMPREHYDLKSKDLVRFVYRSCGWQKKLTYRIAGTVDGKLVYFDLRTAYEIHEGRMKEAEKQKDA